MSIRSPFVLWTVLAALTLLLGGCIDDVSYPPLLRFDDADVGSAPPPVTFEIASENDETVTVRLSSWSPEWLSVSPSKLVVEPGGVMQATVTAAACEEEGERVGAVALSAVSSHTRSSWIRVEMTCGTVADAKFGDVGAYQGPRIGPVEWDPRLDIPIVNDRPGAFRAEVVANFDPTAHVEVEAVVLDADGKPVEGVSPLERLRDPQPFDHPTAGYAVVHEFKAPSRAFDPDVEVVLRLDPDGRLPEDRRDNNEVRPLADAPRLPTPLPGFILHMIAVTMTIIRDGEEHRLATRIPDCPAAPPAGCFAQTLDWTPLPTDKVRIIEHPNLDIGTLEWTDEHTNAGWGMSVDVQTAIEEQFAAKGHFVEGVSRELQYGVAFVPKSHAMDWNKSGYSGLVGKPAIIIHFPNNREGEELRFDYDVKGFSNLTTIAHEIGHNFGAGHAWFEGNLQGCLGGKDVTYTYVGNGGGDHGTGAFFSGDPDGDGPLRVRPGYARLGTAGRTDPTWGIHYQIGFLDQTQPVGEVMDCSMVGASRPEHISDYHYLMMLFTLGVRADLTWSYGTDCLQRDFGTPEWDAYSNPPCPWVRSGSAVGPSVRSKSAAAPALNVEGVRVSGHVDGEGRFLSHGARAKRGVWAPQGPAADGRHKLLAYDANGMVAHAQPLALQPVFHMEGMAGRYVAVVPRGDAVRVEIRDLDGALMIELEVQD